MAATQTIINEHLVIPFSEFNEMGPLCAAHREDSLVRDLWVSKLPLAQSLRNGFDDEIRFRTLRSLWVVPPKTEQAGSDRNTKKPEPAQEAPALVRGLLLPLPHVRDYFLLLGRYFNHDTPNDLLGLKDYRCESFATAWIIPKESLKLARIESSKTSFFIDHSSEPFQSGKIEKIDAEYLKNVQFFAIDGEPDAPSLSNFQAWEIQSKELTSLIGCSSLGDLYRERPFFVHKAPAGKLPLVLFPSLIELIGLTFRLTETLGQKVYPRITEVPSGSPRFRAYFNNSLNAIGSFFSSSSANLKELLEFQPFRNVAYLDNLVQDGAAEVLFKQWKDALLPENVHMGQLHPYPNKVQLKSIKNTAALPSYVSQISRLKTHLLQEGRPVVQTDENASEPDTANAKNQPANWIVRVEKQSLSMQQVISLVLMDKKVLALDTAICDKPNMLSVTFKNYREGFSAIDGMKDMQGTDEQITVADFATTTREEFNQFFKSNAVAMHRILSACHTDLEPKNGTKERLELKDELWTF